MQMRLTRPFGTINEGKAFISLDYENVRHHRQSPFSEPALLYGNSYANFIRVNGSDIEIVNGLNNVIDLDLPNRWSIFLRNSHRAAKIIEIGRRDITQAGFDSCQAAMTTKKVALKPPLFLSIEINLFAIFLVCCSFLLYFQC